MSTGAQQPRRAGGATPPNNAAGSAADQYDSLEVPVLLRLPDLSSECDADAPKPTSSSRRHSRDKARRERTKTSRERRPVEADSKVNTKLVVGGVLLGVVVVAALFMMNGGSTESTDDDAWPEADTVVQEPDIEIPGITEDIDPESAVASFESEVPGDAEPTTPPTNLLEPPDLADVPQVPVPNASTSELADGAQVDGSSTWGEDQSTPLFPDDDSGPSGPVVAWPDTTASGGNYRLGPHGSADEVHRTSRLDRPATGSDEPGENILQGTIETPTPTSFR